MTLCNTSTTDYAIKPFYGVIVKSKCNFCPPTEKSLKRIILLLVLLRFFVTDVSAQTFRLSGKVFEKGGLQPVIGVSVALKQNNKVVNGTTTNEKGIFEFAQLKADTYDVHLSYVGLKPKTIRVTLVADKYMGGIFMDKDQNALGELKVEADAVRVEQKGDTTSIHAGAFKVNPDATAEDLLKKMPGITVENGTVKAQGEDVKKVLVDGKEFFGDDANMALKNLPAEIIDKVQVFNRLNDQAQFTGFNDGNTDKTMNITTRSGRNNGKFGKFYAGYGTDDRYSAGLNYNTFKGDRRLSILGMTNNINIQNFSPQDLFGGSAPPQGMRVYGGGGGMRGGGGGGGGIDPSSFFVGQQSGIATTNSIGTNYSDKWGKKTVLSGSYFFNSSSTITEKETDRQILLNPESKQFYRETLKSTTDNLNSRFNLRLEHTFDSSNSLVYTPRFNYQQNKTNSTQFAANSLNDTTLNSTNTQKTPENYGYTLSNNLLLRHKFKTAGRTLSLNLSNDLNYRNSSTDQTSDNYAINNAGVLVGNNFKQRSTSITNNNNSSANLTYTENLTPALQLMVSYNPSLALNDAERRTNRYDTLSKLYTITDSTLSNTFNNTVTTQRGNISFNLNKEKYSLTAGVTGQHLILASKQSYPRDNQYEKTFVNLLPSVTYQYKFTNSKTLRLVYRTNTNTPSVTQLQNVIDNSNPLLLSSGNPNLKQEYSHTLVTRYGINNWHNTQTLFVFAMVSFTNDYIANGTYTAMRDSILPGGILLGRGSQISQPVNLNGNINARSFVTYGIPMKKIKSNLNLNLGVNYSKVPGQVNRQLNYANTLNLTGGLVLGSNISERVDFTLSHNANINYVENSILVNSNNNYFINSSNFKVNVMPTPSFVITSEWNYNTITGLGSSFNTTYLLWNGGIAYKVMKRMGEVKLSVFDLLNQNNSVNRSVTETYVEDTRSNVLRRYFMLTFTYTLRKFGDPSNKDGNPPPFFQLPPPGSQPPGR